MKMNDSIAAETLGRIKMWAGLKRDGARQAGQVSMELKYLCIFEAISAAVDLMGFGVSSPQDEGRDHMGVLPKKA